MLRIVQWCMHRWHPWVENVAKSLTYYHVNTIKAKVMMGMPRHGTHNVTRSYVVIRLVPQEFAKRLQREEMEARKKLKERQAAQQSQGPEDDAVSIHLCIYA